MRLQLPILSFLVLPLILLPLPWHLRARNIATLTIITCLFLLNLIHGINSIVWAGNVITRLPVWCDITTKFSIGSQFALPAASLCIAKHLECVASVRQTMQTARDKRRRQIFELFLCVVLPCIIMALHYIVQGHRFDIAEDIGCIATVYYSWPALLIVYIPPLVVSFCTLVYAVLAFVWFMKRRAQFAEHLRSNNSGLTTGRYMRLMAMAVSEILIGSGLGGYVLGVNFQDSHLRVWDNWANVHSNFSRVAQYPRVLVPEFFWDRMLMVQYIPIIGAVAFFCFFGFGQEAMAEYRRVCLWIRVHLLRQPLKPTQDSVLPTFSAPQRSARAVRVVRLDDLDLDAISVDEKYPDRVKHAMDASSHRSASPSGSTPSSPRHIQDLPLQPIRDGDRRPLGGASLDSPPSGP